MDEWIVELELYCIMYEFWRERDRDRDRDRGTGRGVILGRKGNNRSVDLSNYPIYCLNV